MIRQNVQRQHTVERVVHFEDYKHAGVDTDEADAGLVRLTDRIKATWPQADAFGAVKLPIGYFANVVDFGGMGVAITTDGIGSKAKIATMLGKYDSVGIDCVAMNVNDLICVGAKPISMVDYVAVEQIQADMLDEIAIGLCKGAELAGISISGGETAQLKDMVKGFDLAGTAIGHVPLDRILVGQDIRAGDVLIGIESSGVHSNGLTLARRAFFKCRDFDVSSRLDDLSCSVGEELIRPTHIYVREALKLLNEVKSVKALVHITSDGFLNLARVKAHVGYVIDNLPPAPPVFDMISRFAEVDSAEMYSVFNMGIGFTAVVGADDVDQAVQILSSEGKRAFQIGHVIEDPEKTVSIVSKRLVGQGKHFRHV